MRGFVTILFLQALVSCGLVTLAVFVRDITRAFNSNEYMAWMSLFAFLFSCILLRFLLFLSKEDSRHYLAVGLCVYTIGLSVLGCQIGAWMVSASGGEEELRRGQMAVAIGCVSILVSFLGIQLQSQPLPGVLLQSTAIVLFVFGSAIVVLDDRVWEWKYAYVMLFSLAAAAYLNGLATYLSPAGLDPLTTCAHVILQPVIFAEGWMTACLLA